MDYKKAYIFLFNQFTELMEAHPELSETVIAIQQQAEDIIIEGEE